MMRIKIGERIISEDASCFIIAEAGINHNGDIKIAKEMIKAAKQCGADAIKFQTFKAEEFIADPNTTYTYYSQCKQVSESMLEIFKRCEFSSKQWEEIIDYCYKQNILFLTTPQNPSDLDFILNITNLPAIKVGSDDLTNLDLISYYASKKIPIIISAGMAFASEIEDAINVIKEVGNKNIVVLHCVSSYPSDASELNINKMKTIKEAFGVIVGFSDHSIGISAAIASVALGAKVIEKHFTIDKNLPGPDHWFSADVYELCDLIKSVKFVEKSLGSSKLIPTDKEMEMRKIARRSIVASRDLKKGTRITECDISYKRPGTGIAPKFKKYIINRQLKKSINKDELISLDYLD